MPPAVPALGEQHGDEPAADLGRPTTRSLRDQSQVPRVRGNQHPAGHRPYRGDALPRVQQRRAAQRGRPGEQRAVRDRHPGGGPGMERLVEDRACEQRDRQLARLDESRPGHDRHTRRRLVPHW